MNATATLFEQLLAGTRKSVNGYCDGESCGTFRPVRFEGGAVGWQATDDSTSEVLGILDSVGTYGSPFEGGNRTWKICAVTQAHIDALEAASQEWLQTPFEWK